MGSIVVGEKKITERERGREKITEREREGERVCVRKKSGRGITEKVEENQDQEPSRWSLWSLTSGEKERRERRKERERGEVFAGVLFYFSFPCCETLPSLFPFFCRFYSFSSQVFFSLSLLACFFFLLVS